MELVKLNSKTISSHKDYVTKSEYVNLLKDKILLAKISTQVIQESKANLSKPLNARNYIFAADATEKEASAYKEILVYNLAKSHIEKELMNYNLEL